MRMLLLLLWAAPAAAMSPSTVSVPPRSPVSVFSGASGEGLGVSLLSRRSARSSDSQNTLTWRTELLADYQVLPRTTLLLSVPHVYHHAAAGGLDQTTNGLGDIALYAKQALWRDRPEHPWAEAGLLAGVKLPSGTTSARSQGMRLPAPQQPGSGTIDFVVGATAWRRFSRVTLYSDLTYKLNTRAAYTFGDLLSANAGLSYPVPGAELLSLTGEANAEATAADRSLELGRVPDTGGETLYLTPGLQWQALLNLTLSVSVQLPVHQDLRGAQLRSGPNLDLGAHARF